MKSILIPLVLLLFLSLPISHVFAADSLDNPPEGDYQNSATFVTMKLGMADTVKAIAGQVVGISIVGDVTPLVVKENELNVTDMTPYSQWLEQASSRLYSETSKEITVPYTKGVNRESAKYCAVLTIQGGPFPKIVKYVTTEPTTTQWSNPITWTNPLDEYTEKMATALSGYTKDVNTQGTLDYNWEEQSVKHIGPEDCGPSDEGTQNHYEINGVNSHATFGPDASVTQTISDTIVNAIGEATEILCKKEVRLTKKLRLSNTPVLGLGSYNNTIEELTSDIISKTRTPKDGWTAAFVPEDKKITPTPFGSSPNKLTLNAGGKEKAISYNNPEQIINRAGLNMEQSTCLVTPQSEIQNTFIGTDEKTWLPINGHQMCDALIPEPEEQGGWNCKTNLPELASEQTNTQGKQWADNLVNPPCDSTNNAWEMCHNDVIDRASKPNSCYDPIFALTIWLHETGASNYECTAQVDNVPENLVEDFGQHSSTVPKQNFSAQLDSLLSLSYADKTCPHTMNDWWSIFWQGKCFSEIPDSPPDPVTQLTPKQQVEHDIGYLQTLYSMLGGGTLPAWPVTCN